MRILITGSYGFIGSQVTATLSSAGHDIVCCARDVNLAKNRFPPHPVIPCDFVNDNKPEIWIPRLKDIDMVVNCVGVLQTKSAETIDAIHNKTPRALIDACKQAGVKKFVHISALGIDSGVDTPYAKTKLAFEKYLENMDYPWVILRPSLIYGTGSYGGTSLFRALSALPFVLPIVGQGTQLFQPIHIRELAKTIQVAIEKPEIAKQRINVVGPETMSLENILILLRQWLGYAKAKILHIPLSFIKWGSYLGNWFQDIPINSTSYKMLSVDIIADVKPFIETVGFTPSKMEDNLKLEPASTQDRWHARLYFLNPLLRITLGILWIFSGLIPLLTFHSYSFHILDQFGITGPLATLAFYGSTFLDIFLGLATLAQWRLKWIGCIQIALIILYTLFLTLFIPELWLDPLGTLLKNIPLIVATLIMMVLSEAR